MVLIFDCLSMTSLSLMSTLASPPSPHPRRPVEGCIPKCRSSAMFISLFDPLTKGEACMIHQVQPPRVITNSWARLWPVAKIPILSLDESNQMHDDHTWHAFLNGYMQPFPVS